MFDIMEVYMVDVIFLWNNIESGGIFFFIGNMFNLCMICVLKDLKFLVVFSISDCLN